jgi:LytS/YehU family sensor histidine kinase
MAIENERIQFVCKNKFNANRQLKQQSNGLGNKLIEKRLRLLYPEKHILDIKKEKEQYSVNLLIVQKTK